MTHDIGSRRPLLAAVAVLAGADAALAAYTPRFVVTRQQPRRPAAPAA